MTVRRRTWTSGGERKTAWIADWRDGDGVRRQRTFPTKKEAAEFEAVARVLSNNGEGTLPERRLVAAFYAPLPKAKRKDTCQAVRDTLLKCYPNRQPSHSPMIVHVIVECAPSSAVCDVDNLLKPVLDALAGRVYINDTQVIEVLARKRRSDQNRLLIRVWSAPEFNQMPTVAPEQLDEAA